MFTRTICTALCVLVPGLATAGGPIDVTFADHITMGMVEQDVFVTRDGSSDVFRVTTEDQADYLDNMAFSATSEIAHHPMNMTAVGPFAKGRELGFTLGNWLSATGSGSVSCTDGKGALSASFTGLVPDGVYTMWLFYVAIPFPEPWMTYELPFGARNGSQSLFTSHASGNASFEGSVGTCLQGSGSQIAEGLAIAYHSDGQGHGPHMGPAGADGAMTESGVWAV